MTYNVPQARRLAGSQARRLAGLMAPWRVAARPTIPYHGALNLIILYTAPSRWRRCVRIEGTTVTITARMERLARIMSSQYKKAFRDDPANIMFLMDETDMTIWYIMVLNMGDPYKGGEYIFKLTATKNFPVKPPVFEALTPSGVFELGGRVCISIGDFHPNEWRGSLGLPGFAWQIYNSLVSVSYTHLTLPTIYSV